MNDKFLKYINILILLIWLIQSKMKNKKITFKIALKNKISIDIITNLIFKKYKRLIRKDPDSFYSLGYYQSNFNDSVNAYLI